MVAVASAGIIGIVLGMYILYTVVTSFFIVVLIIIIVIVLVIVRRKKQRIDTQGEYIPQANPYYDSYIKQVEYENGADLKSSLDIKEEPIYEPLDAHDDPSPYASFVPASYDIPRKSLNSTEKPPLPKRDIRSHTSTAAQYENMVQPSSNADTSSIVKTTSLNTCPSTSQYENVPKSALNADPSNDQKHLQESFDVEPKRKRDAVSTDEYIDVPPKNNDAAVPPDEYVDILLCKKDDIFFSADDTPDGYTPMRSSHHTRDGIYSEVMDD